MGAVGFEGTASYSLLNSTDLRFAAVIYECVELGGRASGWFDPGEIAPLDCSDGSETGSELVLSGPPSQNYSSIEIYDRVGDLMYEQRPIEDALWQVRPKDGGETEIVLELFSDDVDRSNAGLCCCTYDNFTTIEILEIEACEAIADGVCEMTFPPGCEETALTAR